jgi:hypothetical protein
VLTTRPSRPGGTGRVRVRVRVRVRDKDRDRVRVGVRLRLRVRVGFSEAAVEHAAAQVVAALALHRARHDALRQPRLPQREDLAAQSDHVRVGHVLERQPARVGQHAALRLRAKRVALEDSVSRLLLLEVRRAHEAALEARPARRAIDRNAAEVPVAVEHMLEPLPASLKVAGPVPPQAPFEVGRDGALYLRDLVLVLAWH